MEREDYVRHFGFTLDEYTKRFGFDKMFKAMEDRIMHLEEMGNNKDWIMKAQDECIETKKEIIQLLERRLDYLQALPIVREEQNKEGANRECTILYLNPKSRRR